MIVALGLLALLVGSIAGALLVAQGIKAGDALDDLDAAAEAEAKAKRDHEKEVARLYGIK